MKKLHKESFSSSSRNKTDLQTTKGLKKQKKKTVEAYINPMSRKSSKTARRPARMNKELLEKLTIKQEAHASWKQGCVTWEEVTSPKHAGMR